jgi:hypothetical protein
MSSDDTRTPPDFYTPEVRSPAYDEPEHGDYGRRPPGYEDYEFQYPRRRRPRRRSWPGRILRGTALVVTGGALVAAAVYLLPAIPTDRLRAVFATSSPAPTAQAPATPAPKPVAAPINVPDNSLIGKQAQAWGITACLAPLVSTADDLTHNTDYNYRLVRGQNDPDQEMLSGVIAAREPKTGVSGISSFYAQPTNAGRCDLAYQTTIYFDEPCPQALQHHFPQFTRQLNFGQIASAYVTDDGRLSVYLLPAGKSGCLTVSTGSAY